MRTSRLILVFGYLFISAWAAHAVDLTKIDRVVAKEPKYQGKPKYCLVVFGPEAKFRVWLVLDGNVLYVDRNGNGDLTEPGERVEGQGQSFVIFKPGKVGPPDGKTKYKLSQVVKERDGHYWLSVYADAAKYWARGGFDGPGPLRFADRPQDAPILHFLGPLTLQRFEPQDGSVSPHLAPGPLVRGQACHLAFSLGTPGLGSGTFAKYPYDGKPALAEVRFPGGKTVTASLKPDL